MELSNEFEVGVGIDEAWDVLTDLERIAPCLPGATLKEVVEVDGVTHYHGTVKVKVGPIQATYKGEAHLVEEDRDSGRVLLVAAGREARGQGTASASISAQLTERPGDDGPCTQVSLVTDLSVTGKVAQFGRGVLSDVSAKLLGTFVENLERTVLAAEDGGGATVVETVEEAITEVVDADPGEALGEVVETVDTVEVVDESTGDEVVVVTDTIEVVDEATGEREEVATVRTVASVEAEPIDLLDTAGTPVLKRVLPVVAAVAAVLVVLRVLRRRRG
ncbi:MAG: SRPBCC family protein [Acidimicrobiales bacterium]